MCIRDRMKGVGTPEYYLGGDVRIVYKDDVISKMLLNAKTYVTLLTKKIEDLMEWTLRHYTHPGDPTYHPEITSLLETKCLSIA